MLGAAELAGEHGPEASFAQLVQEVQTINIELDDIMDESLGAKWHSLYLTCTYKFTATFCRLLDFFFFGTLRHR